MSSFGFVLSFACVSGILSACASGNCRQNRIKDGEKNQALTQAQSDFLDQARNIKERVRIYKSDGTRQCEKNDPVALSEMEKQLSGIVIHKSYHATDNLFHASVCGGSTGGANVFEIDRKSLLEAKKRGFNEWTFD